MSSHVTMSSNPFEPPVFLPTAPRRARLIAPFVLLFGLVVYAAIVMAALTAPQPAQSAVTGQSARVVAMVQHLSDTAEG